MIRLLSAVVSTLLLVAPCVVHAQLRIQEVMPSNASGLKDEGNKIKDWLEIANPSAQAVDLTGWYLTDDPENLKRWQFPVRSIPAGGFLVVFADNTTRAPSPDGELHANFALGTSSGRVMLVKPDGVTVVSELVYPRMFPDIAYGLGPDGKLGYLGTPTPRAENGPTAVHAKSEVTFSHAHGFFTEPFALTLTATLPGSKIRYTLDGTKPTDSVGEDYSGPITVIPDTSAARKGSRLVRAVALNQEAAYAPVATSTYLFLVGTGNPNNDGVVTQSNFRATILSHATYGPLMRDSLLALPTVSIVGLNRPPTVEGEISMELFDPQNREAGFTITGGVKATGTTSLSSPKQSMNIAFRGKYGAPSLRYPVYKDHPFAAATAATEFNELRLRSGSHDTFYWLGTRENPPVPYGTPPVRRSGDAQYVRNIWIEDMQLIMGQPGKRGRMVQMYMNGSYYGIYHIQEHADEDYMAQYYGGVSQDWHFTGGGTTGSDHGNGDTWRVSWGKMKASTSNYATAKRWIDLPNLADYMILSFYAGNDWDWSATHNWGAAGPKDMDRGGWKFFQQDSDICLQDVNADCTDQTVPDNVFHTLMTRHADFKALFRDRVYLHCFHNGALTAEKVAGYYNYRANEIFTAIVAETARWQPTSTVEKLPWDRDGEWINEWNYLKNVYFPYRTDALIQQLRKRGWYGADPPEFVQRGGEVNAGGSIGLAAPPQSVVYYTTDGTDPRVAGTGGASSSAKIYSTPASEVSILPPRSTWKYMSSATAPADAWRGLGFDDSSWASDAGEFGYGQEDLQTVIPGDQRNLTTYFRRAFEVPDASIFPGLTLRLKRDDGAVVYLNGREIVRANLPGGPVLADTRATLSNDNGQTWQEFLISPYQFSLRNGTNQLAVEVHQVVPSDTDMRFDLELLGNPVTVVTPITISQPTVIKARALRGTADWSPLNEASFVLAGTPKASAANLTVTEIHYHPYGDEAVEFVELHNPSAEWVEASGVKLSGAVEAVTPLGTVIPPGGYVVIVGNRSAFDGKFRDPGSPWYREGIVVAAEWTGGLSNSKETLTILAADGSVIGSAAYEDSGDWPGRADGRGSSLELIDAKLAPKTATEKTAWLGQAKNWRPSSEFQGSPGAAGRGPDNRVVINEVLTASTPLETDAIELLNTTNAPISLSGWFLSDDADNYRKFRFPEANPLAPGEYLLLREDVFNNPAVPAALVPFGLDSSGQSIYLVEADSKGNLLRFVDRAEVPKSEPGKTFGRVPNGSGPLQVLAAPSLGSANGDAGASGYAAWAAKAFPAGADAKLTAAMADYDGDRLLNLAEFAFATSPTVPNPAPLTVSKDGQTFGYRVRTDLGGAKVRVGVSTDLVAWDSSEAQVEVIERKPDGEATLITAKPRPANAPRRFVRLEVSQ